MKQGPTIGDITGDKTVAKENLPPPSPAPEPSAETALDNYKAIADTATDPATKAEASRRLADLQIQLDESAGTDAQSEARQRDSIARYQALLEQNSTDSGNDRVLYQLARAQQNVGEWQVATETLRRLTDEFPKSAYAIEARFRLAELKFQLKDFAAAADEYSLIMGMGADKPYYERAQYKFGWSQFKQGKYREAIAIFLPLLERELPAGEHADAKAAMAELPQKKRDIAQEALRVTTLSFSYMGGGEALNSYIVNKGEPRFYLLLYYSLGDALLERKRYSDAAQTYVAFQKRYARHALAPSFQTRSIKAYQEGGFPDLVVKEKERYIELYEPKAGYWAGRSPTPEVLAQLRTEIGDLASYHHARAQKAKEASQPNTADFLTAAQWYRRGLEIFPTDKDAAPNHLLMADALLDGGKTLDAAQEYGKLAERYPQFPKAAEAAYAAVLAYHKHSGEVDPAQKPTALKQAVDASFRFAASYPQRDEAPVVMVRAAEDLYQLKDMRRAVEAAGQALKSERPLAAELKLTAWSVAADSHFDLKQWREAEGAYSEVLKLLPIDAPDQGRVTEQIAIVVYKQGEDARTAKKLREAAGHFLRVGQLAPASAIRSSADYDAAAALLTLKDWPAAAKVLEDFLQRYPNHKLTDDVDKKLALAYQNDGKPQLAATVFQRIAARSAETPETRREAAWTAATMLEQAGQSDAAAEGYKNYLAQFPQPLNRATEARQKLLRFAETRGDETRRLAWLKEIIEADAAAGTARSDVSRLAAAQATLELARRDVRAATAVTLKLPLEKSIGTKKKALEQAITSLTRAGDYGFAAVTTASSYELGALYQDFAQSLLKSDRPRKLSELELEQYNLLLEEQAFPFEEKAIQFHEANLKRIEQGVYDPWVGKSAGALAQIVPGKYGKREQGEDSYSAFR